MPVTGGYTRAPGRELFVAAKGHPWLTVATAQSRVKLVAEYHMSNGEQYYLRVNAHSHWYGQIISSIRPNLNNIQGEYR